MKTIQEELLNIDSIKAFWNLAGKHWGLCLPNGSLYHYTSSVKAIQNILTNGEFWMSKSSVMNDFSEISYGINLARSIIKQEAIQHNYLDMIIKKIDQAIAEKIFGDVYILSFSENGNSRLLWDSYARKSGYNVEVDSIFISDLFSNARLQKHVFNNVSNKYDLLDAGMRKVDISSEKTKYVKPGISLQYFANKVLYDQKQQEKIISDIIHFILNLKGTSREKYIDFILTRFLDFIPFFKDPSLSDEEEYRFIIRIQSSRENMGEKRNHLVGVEHYREVDNKLFPYIILKLNDRSYYKSVCLGYCNSDELSINTFRDFLSTTPGNVQLKCAKFALRF